MIGELNAVIVPRLELAPRPGAGGGSSPRC